MVGSSFPRTQGIRRMGWLGLVLVAWGTFPFRCSLAQEGKAPTHHEKSFQPIDLSPFASGIHHWRRLRDDTRWIQVQPDQPSYDPHQVPEIVSNLLLFQRQNGGWPKDYDMTAILTPEQRDAISNTRTKDDTSYDNGNIHSQVAYLAKAYVQSQQSEWRLACERGFDFMLRSQYPNGGIPQRFPSPKGFHAHITFNDGVMMGALRLFRDAARGAKHFEWLDQDRRTAAAEAVRRGVDCLLKCQIEVDGKKTGWCQQHDEVTYEARPARTFELASICPQETTDIVEFLMAEPAPSLEVTQGMEAAIDWLKKVAISGIRVEKVAGTKESFLRHDVDFDVKVIEDPKAKRIWARHYEIGTNRPVFAGRDGIKKYALDAIERERRTGTAWYGYWPEALLAKVAKR